MRSISWFSLALFVSIGSGAQTSPSKTLTEAEIVKWVKENSTLSDSLQAETSAKKLDAALTQEMFETRLKASHFLKRSDEKPSSSQPLLSPFSETSLMVEKKFPVGLAASAGLFANQSSAQNGSFKDDTQMGIAVQAEVDLWKNFFGRLDKANLNLSKSKISVADLESQLNLRRRQILVRKLYWSLIAADRNLELSLELLKSAEVQLKEAEKRLNAGIADRGEVAKYRSQVDSRRASEILFEYEKQVLSSELEKVLNSFQFRDWALAKNEFEAQDPVINQCLQQIATNKAELSSLSDYAAIIEGLKAQYESEKNLAEAHSSSDFKLVGQWQSTGRGNSYSTAESDWSDDKKSGYSLGLQLSVPLDGKSKTSEAELKLLKEKEYSAKIKTLENELKTTHQKMSQSLELLGRGLSSQGSNSKNLEANYVEMRKKFQQGRITFVTLIAEQDLLFQSKLQEIGIKKQIAHATLDYLAVFNKFPCQWNSL